MLSRGSDILLEKSFFRFLRVDVACSTVFLAICITMPDLMAVTAAES